MHRATVSGDPRPPDHQLGPSLLEIPGVDPVQCICARSQEFQDVQGYTNRKNPYPALMLVLLAPALAVMAAAGLPPTGGS